MVIVTVTRNDLRDEFAMADEAFALSPISARAAMPSEADYDAIREAFMETSRGRWFLTEYAKRNRNADTSMVLDAVARIEQTLAAQKQVVPDDGLAKALAAIRNSLDEARNAATSAFDKQTGDDVLIPIQKGVRIIREISWRWREIGGDGRICDLLDSQAETIERVHTQLAARDDKAALQAAFGLIETTLDSLSGETAASSSVQAKTAPQAGMDGEAPVSRTTAEAEPPPQADITAAPLTVGTQETGAEAAVVAATAERDQNEHSFAQGKTEQDMAEDDAVLDAIALEMGAPDFDEPETGRQDVNGAEIAQPQPDLELEAIEENSNTSLAPEPEVAAPPSLGASLLESGIVVRAAPRSDPLAPIRRMTQAEKIAFFS